MISFRELELHAVPLAWEESALEASLLYICADGTSFAVLVDTLSDEPDGDYDFVLQLKEVKDLPQDADLVLASQVRDGWCERTSEAKAIKILAKDAELVIKPSSRFYFSLRVEFSKCPRG